jgi:hypothetical protein
MLAKSDGFDGDAGGMCAQFVRSAFLRLANRTSILARAGFSACHQDAAGARHLTKFIADSLTA